MKNLRHNYYRQKECLLRKIINILMILQSDYPPDIRLNKEFKTLIKAGYHIFLLCNNNKNFPQTEKLNGATIIRLPKFSFLPFTVQKFLRLPTFFSPLWFSFACKIIKKYKIDAIHVHDLPPAPMGVIISKMFNLPMVYDMHENYPAALEEWKKRGGFFQGIIKNPTIAKILNNFSLKHATKIIVVVDEQKQNLIKKNISPDKIYIVENTVDIDSFTNKPFNQDIINKYKDNFGILYLGAFSTERGLETSIEAMKKIRKEIPKAKLLLVGDGKNTPELKMMAKDNQLNSTVEFTGWVDFSDVPSYMQASQICIIPQPSNPSNDTTCPHKLFQYMMVGKPVLCADAVPLKRIVNECQCGETFISENSDDFAQKAIDMANKINVYGENGKKWVYEKYNWQKTSIELLKLYSRLS